jgi:ABC-type uncharacterized transport system substrate-binding protein
MGFRAILLAIWAAAAVVAGAGHAHAHPHVWVVARGELVYGPDGAIQAVRYAWTFDEAFSTFATQGLDKDGDGKLSREELKELAEVNVTSLKEFEYFTFGKGGQAKIEFNAPVDYWLEADAQKMLTLHFTLPVKAAPKGSVSLDIYDPTYFVAFELADGTPMKLSGAPKGCTLEAKKPEPPSTSMSRLSESFFNSLSAASQYGSQFANHIAVRCP